MSILSRPARSAAIMVALIGSSAVLLGAFGAHAFSATLDARGEGLWRTAVGYHFWHALAFTIGVVAVPHGRARRVSLFAFALGVLLFCGSLYALALGAPSWVGVLTPIGGIAFVVGWLALAHSIGARRRPDPDAASN